MGLFSNTGKKISNTVNNVQKKTEDSLKVRKIQGQIRSAEEEIQRLYTAAGKCCYEAHLTGTGAESAVALYDNITELRAAIEKYTEEIDAINRVRRCPACNAVVSDTARFCSSCGAEIPELVVEPVAEAPVSREICPNCGAERQEGARFCTGCGHDFETKTAEDPEEPAHEDDLQ
ncbi:MAG: zinc ribbon domain-containing protein [Eubacteriales bacterium]|nr:zinc ribbon domain-containing protein [Eubacteriales bacterium]